MNRTIRLLRPLASSTPASLGKAAAVRIRPSALVLAQQGQGRTLPAPTASSQSMTLQAVRSANPALAVILGARRYASASSPLNAEQSKAKDKDGKSKYDGSHANPRVDHQNATASARQEIRGATKDLAEIIRGSGHYVNSTLATESSAHGHGGSISEDWRTITTGLFQAIPNHALVFGAAGLLPYLGTSVATIVLAREAANAAAGNGLLSLTDALSYLHTVEHVQITYGAIILSFLGAIHWGFEFGKVGGEQGWKRLAIGTLPVLFAWPTTFLPHGIALATQWAGFTTMWMIDQRATSNGWTTFWYSSYRFYLSIVVGFSIIATLWVTGYYGAGAGAITSTDVKHMQHTTERVSPMKRLDRLKEKENPKYSGKQAGTVSGDMQVDERQDGEGYLRLRNVAKEREEEEEEENEERKQKEEENERQKQEKAELHDKKDEGQMNQAPGRMKDTAPDRTGKNRNVPGGEELQEGEKGPYGMGNAVKEKQEEEGTGKGDKGRAIGNDSRGADGSNEEKKNSGAKPGQDHDGSPKDDGKKGGDPSGPPAADEKGAAGEGLTPAK